MIDRLRAYYTENVAGVTTEMFEAVLDRRPRSAYDFDRRVQALAVFLTLADAPALAAANKRIANILRKSDESEGTTSITPTPLVQVEELSLQAALNEC